MTPTEPTNAKEGAAANIGASIARTGLWGIPYCTPKIVLVTNSAPVVQSRSRATSGKGNEAPKE